MTEKVTAATDSSQHTQKLQAETTALRLLADGYSIDQVTDRTHLPRHRLIELCRDFPSAPRQPPPPKHDGPPRDLHIDKLLTHPGNIRSNLGPTEELADTIAEHGILQPLLVTRSRDGQYVVLDGHRRLAAARQAGLLRVPVVHHDRLDPENTTIVMLVTALQKAELHPLDEARAYRRLIDAGRSQAEIGALVGRHQAHVSQRLALLNLTPAEQAAVRAGDVGVVEAYKTGRERGSRRMQGVQRRPKPKTVPHFHGKHPLADAARARCGAAGHDTLFKLGPACGPCWEDTIRRDALSEHALDCEQLAPDDGRAEQHLIDQREDAVRPEAS